MLTLKLLSKKIVGYFLQGLLYTVPIAITIYIIYQLFLSIDDIIPVDKPGLGILILFSGITVLGFLGSTIIAQPIIAYFTKFIEKAPLVKTIYSSIKDLVSAFVGKKKRFDRPVLVKVNKDSNLEKLGFITQNDLRNFGIEGDKVAVYLPHSYAFSGNLFVISKENVTPINASSADVMKFIVSGGVVNFGNGNKDELSEESEK